MIPTDRTDRNRTDRPRGDTLPRFSQAEELAHALTHGLGAALSLVGLVFLVGLAAWSQRLAVEVSAAVYGGSLLLLYTASTLYHGVRHQPAKRWLQALDQCAIFALIAGSYTPFALLALGGGQGWLLLALIWGLAIAGIVLRLTLGAGFARWEMALYLPMGWLGVAYLPALASGAGLKPTLFVIAGGLAYTVGVIFYAWRALPFNHLLWHLYVMAGSAIHFAAVAFYILPAASAGA